MYDLLIIWIALVLLVAVGTLLSTRLYTRFGKGNQARGNRHHPELCVQVSDK
jgi:hypothetical protein